jgi:hypothetical protein
MRRSRSGMMLRNRIGMTIITTTIGSRLRRIAGKGRRGLPEQREW